MKPDDFEKRLQRQSLQQIPAGWREEILAAVEVNRRTIREPAFVAALGIHLRELLLSFRWHLTGMSAAWIIIALLNIDHSPGPVNNIAKEKTSPPRQLLLSLGENRRRLLEMIESSVVEPVPGLPRRRSELQPVMVMV